MQCDTGAVGRDGDRDLKMKGFKYSIHGSTKLSRLFSAGCAWAAEEMAENAEITLLSYRTPGWDRVRRESRVISAVEAQNMSGLGALA